MKIKFSKVKTIEGLYKIKLQKVEDHRGYFGRLFSKDIFKKKKFELKQINISFNKKKGTIRGFHFAKPPSKEKKIIFCLKGRLYDVLIDLRKKSKTFKKIFSIELTEKKSEGLFVPEGVAHGFQTLEKETILIYFHSDFYNKKYDSGINPFNKNINIKWPIQKFVISKKDKKQKNLIEAYDL